jgi:hypothetical protein
MLSIITIPTNAAADMLAYSGTLFTDLWPILLVVVGVPFGFYVVSKTISLFRKHAK